MIRCTLAQATRFILQKNYLAEVKAASFNGLLADLGGLPSSSERLTVTLAAQQRLTTFQPSGIDVALYDERTALRMVAMRNESYVINTADFVSYQAATARQRKQAFNAEFRLWGITNEEVERLSQQVSERVTAATTLGDIQTNLPPDTERVLTQTSRGGRVSQTTNLQLVLRWLIAQGVLYSDCLPKSFTVNTIISPLQPIYPDLDVSNPPDEAQAQTALVRRYLAAFGPATEADISFWTGFGKSETARAVGNLTPETTMTMVEGIPGMLLLLKSQAEALQAVELRTQPIVHLLPANDPFVTAHRASRSRYFDNQKLQRKLFNHSGQAKPTILVNGKIVGSWQMSAEEELSWQLLETVASDIQPLIEAEVARIKGS